jgi:hypothetical protein
MDAPSAHVMCLISSRDIYIYFVVYIRLEKFCLVFYVVKQVYRSSVRETAHSRP